VPLRYSEPLVARASGLDPDDWWPLVTNTFMHGGRLHLILNTWTPRIFGAALLVRHHVWGDGMRTSRWAPAILPASEAGASAPGREIERRRGCA
jgi:rhomboid family protein